MAVFEVKLNELSYMAMHSRQRSGQAQGKAVKELTTPYSQGQANDVHHSTIGKSEDNFDRPLLLLDDVFSELDPEHRREVFKLLDKQQTIITTADEGLMPKRYLKRVEIVRL